MSFSRAIESSPRVRPVGEGRETVRDRDPRRKRMRHDRGSAFGGECAQKAPRDFVWRNGVVTEREDREKDQIENEATAVRATPVADDRGNDYDSYDEETSDPEGEEDQDEQSHTDSGMLEDAERQFPSSTSWGMPRRRVRRVVGRCLIEHSRTPVGSAVPLEYVGPGGGKYRLGSAPVLDDRNAFVRHGWYAVQKMEGTAVLTNKVTPDMDARFANGIPPIASEKFLPRPIDGAFYENVHRYKEGAYTPFSLDGLDVSIDSPDAVNDIMKVVSDWSLYCKEAPCTIRLLGAGVVERMVSVFLSKRQSLERCKGLEILVLYVPEITDEVLEMLSAVFAPFELTVHARKWSAGGLRSKHTIMRRASVVTLNVPPSAALFKFIGSVSSSELQVLVLPACGARAITKHTMNVLSARFIHPQGRKHGLDEYAKLRRLCVGECSEKTNVAALAELTEHLELEFKKCVTPHAPAPCMEHAYFPQHARAGSLRARGPDEREDAEDYLTAAAAAAKRRQQRGQEEGLPGWKSGAVYHNGIFKDHHDVTHGELMSGDSAALYMGKLFVKKTCPCGLTGYFPHQPTTARCDEVASGIITLYADSLPCVSRNSQSSSLDKVYECSKECATLISRMPLRSLFLGETHGGATEMDVARFVARYPDLQHIVTQLPKNSNRDKFLSVVFTTNPSLQRVCVAARCASRRRSGLKHSAAAGFSSVSLPSTPSEVFREANAKSWGGSRSEASVDPPPPRFASNAVPRPNRKDCVYTRVVAEKRLGSDSSSVVSTDALFSVAATLERNRNRAAHGAQYLVDDDEDDDDDDSNTSIPRIDAGYAEAHARCTGTHVDHTVGLYLYKYLF